MFRFTFRSIVVPIVAAVAFSSTVAEARPRRIWTYKDLSAEATVICIGTVKSTTKVKNAEFEPDFLDRFDSEIRIRAVLKGDPKLEKLVFVHFKYRPDIFATLGNGPTFAVLDGPKDKAGAAGSRQAPTAFIFFLRRRADGNFGPITGDQDADISVARLDGVTDDE